MPLRPSSGIDSAGPEHLWANDTWSRPPDRRTGRGEAGRRSLRDVLAAYAGGEFGREPSYRLQALLRGGRVEQPPDERRADDHSVGERRDLGRLCAVADAQ